MLRAVVVAVAVATAAAAAFDDDGDGELIDMVGPTGADGDGGA